MGGQLALQDHLEGDDPVQADLACLVDDAHAAAGDLLQQLVVAEVADPRQGAGLLRAAAGAVGVRGQLQCAGLAVEPIVVGEEGTQPVGQVGMASQQGGALGHDAGLDLLHIFRDDRVERIGMRTDGLVGSAHGFTLEAITGFSGLPGRAVAAR